MSKVTPNYRNPLRAAKNRLVKHVIASLIKALFSMQSGNKKTLIKLLLMVYFLIYGMVVNVKAALSFAWDNRIAVLAVLFFCLVCKYAIYSSKIKTELRKQQKEVTPEEMLGI